jgi:hypothetical protein
MVQDPFFWKNGPGPVRSLYPPVSERQLLRERHSSLRLILVRHVPWLSIYWSEKGQGLR